MTFSFRLIYALSLDITNIYLYLKSFSMLQRLLGGGRVVQWCWVKLSVPGLSTNLDNSRTRVGAGGGCLDTFLSSIISLFLSLSLSLSLGDSPI